MKPTPQAIENAARAMCREAWRGSIVVDGDALADSGDYDRYYYDLDYDLALAALSCDLGDMVLVPKEPTEAMLEAAVVAGHQANKPFVERIKSRSFEAGMSSDITAGDGRIYRAAYRAMIAAAEDTPCK